MLGKTAAIFGFDCLAVVLGFKLPNGDRKRDLLVICVITGTVFTVAIFVAGQVFVDHAVMEAAKMEAMFTIAAAVIGIVLGKVLDVRKRVRWSEYPFEMASGQLLVNAAVRPKILIGAIREQGMIGPCQQFQNIEQTKYPYRLFIHLRYRFSPFSSQCFR